MATFLSFLVILAILGGGFLMNQRRLAKERKSNPIGPYVIRASHAWQNAPPYMRNIMLESAGVTDEAARSTILPKEWHRLPDYAQTGLLKLQMITEVSASNLSDPQGNLKG